MSLTIPLIVLPGALLLDRLLGEPRRFHPLVGFGRLASWLESRLSDAERHSATSQRLRGLLAVLLLVGGLTALGAALTALVAPLSAPLLLLFDVLVLYLAIGGRSLMEHAARVRDALASADLDTARQRTSWLVSRDTAAMSETDMARATVESVLENGCDAVFGALFWFAVAGLPGVIAYRLANTLDAMWGYRTERYRHFGWAAARLDDVLNYIPARLTALSYAVVGRFQSALHCWRAQGYAWESPNAGPVMAAGAGALSVQLGGAASYHGELQQRPDLGLDKAPEAHDIERAVSLVNRGMLLWLAVIFILGVLFG